MLGVNMAYANWAGLCLSMMSLIGISASVSPCPPVRVISLAFIATGVTGLHMSISVN